ncbi:GroES-like protein [Pluteus cervinus]|uniref:GroES-like protein n=1 Tax=Pluteus cervinus TaxID=181527 RepID=A0ACD3AET8_9AGAR|nr:GroES-like protein [Pluteus cervinus]
MSEAPEIPRTARAAVLKEIGGRYTIVEDHPVKQPDELAPGECLVKLEYSGVCHSDVHVKNGDWARQAPLPLVGGHEGVGTVVAIGKGTVNSEVKIGERVGVKWIAATCLRCEMCRKGHESACPLSFQKTHGFFIDGSFAQYVVSYTSHLTPIPEGLNSAAAAPILCAGLTVYKALKQARATIGDWVAISGAGGGLGHLAVQYAVAMGYRVVAIDTGDEKKEICLKLGAEKWVDFKETQDLVQDVKTAADGQGPQSAIIAVGTPHPFNQAVLYLRPTGTLVAVGMPGGAATLEVPVTLLIAKSLTILGTAIGNRQDAIEALSIAASGKVKCWYQVKPLEDLNQVLDDLLAGKVAGRIVLQLSS